jgi:hypothetical protein
MLPHPVGADFVASRRLTVREIVFVTTTCWLSAVTARLCAPWLNPESGMVSTTVGPARSIFVTSSDLLLAVNANAPTGEMAMSCGAFVPPGSFVGDPTIACDGVSSIFVTSFVFALDV